MIESFERGQCSEDDTDLFLRAEAEGGHVAVVRFFLEKGLSVGTAPFAVTGVTKPTAVLELFIEHGWNVNDALLHGHVMLPYVSCPMLDPESVSMACVVLSVRITSS